MEKDDWEMVKASRDNLGCIYQYINHRKSTLARNSCANLINGVRKGLDSVSTDLGLYTPYEGHISTNQNDRKLDA